MRQETGGILLRLVCEGKPWASAMPVQAGLEDLYLYYFSEVTAE